MRVKLLNEEMKKDADKSKIALIQNFLTSPKRVKSRNINI